MSVSKLPQRPANCTAKAGQASPQSHPALEAVKAEFSDIFHPGLTYSHQIPDDWKGTPEAYAVQLKRQLENERQAREKLRDDAEAKTPEGRLKARRFDHLKPPPHIRAVYTLAGVSIATPGNLAAITSEVKTGKSAVIGALIASTISTDGSADLLGFASENPKGLAVLHFDSEQSRYDHFHSIARALKRAGSSEPPPWLYSYFVTGLSQAEALECVETGLAVAARERNGVHSVLLDGIADFVADVNDPAECNAFVAKLQGLAIDHSCPIIGVIHFNPGSNKTRGHLGSQFERKAETNLKLDKNSKGVTTIWGDKQRRAPIPKKEGPCFCWDDRAGMHIRVENQSERDDEEQAHAKATSQRADAEALFSAQEKKALKWGELHKLIELKRELSKDGARKVFNRWVEAKVITKNAANLYELTP